MGIAALVIDVGVLRKANQDLWNSLDAGALAGVPELPGDGVAAEAAALRYAAANYPGLDTSTVHVEFRCVIGDRDGNGQPDLADVPSVCNPGRRDDRVALCQWDLRRPLRPVRQWGHLQHDRPRRE